MRALDFLELFHELEIYGRDLVGAFKPRTFDGFTFRYLDVESDEEVREKFHIQKLAPCVTEIEHELAEYFLVDLDSQQLERIMRDDLAESLQVLLLTLE